MNSDMGGIHFWILDDLRKRNKRKRKRALFGRVIVIDDTFICRQRVDIV